MSRRESPLFAFAYVGSFGAATVLYALAAIAALRSGLETPALVFPELASIGVAALLAPFALPIRLRERLAALRFPLPLCALGVWLSALLALPLGRWVGVVYPLIALVALVGAARALRGLTALEAVSLAVGPALLALYLLSAVHRQPFAHFLTAERALLGGVNLDTGMHTAISSMILHFGLSSTGADGVPAMPYHYGSHAWLAALARIAGCQPFEFYGIAQPALAVPLLFAATFLCGAALARPARLVGCLLAPVALLMVCDRIGWTSYYISESYTFGLTALLLAAPLVFDCVDHPTRGRRADLARAAVLLAAALGIGAMKLSVGFVYCALVGYAVLRSRGPGAWTAGFGALLAGVGLLVLHLFQARTGLPLRDAFAWFPFYREDIPAEMPSRWKAHTSIAPPMLVVAAAVIQARGASATAAAARSVRRRAEVLAVAAAVSMLPGMALVMWATSAWWFQNPPQWLGIPLLLATPWVARAVTRRSVTAAVAAVTAALAIAAVAELPGRLADIGSRIAGLASAVDGVPRVADREFWAYARTNLRRHGRVFDPAFARAVRSSPLARSAEQIVRARGAREDLAVFVPPGNRAYWQPDFPLMAPCLQPPFWIPLLTGAPMLRGIAPDCPEMGLLVGYGVGAYGPESRARASDDAELCAHASTRGFARVFVLASLVRPAENRVLECPAAAVSP